MVKKWIFQKAVNTLVNEGSKFARKKLNDPKLQQNLQNSIQNNKHIKGGLSSLAEKIVDFKPPPGATGKDKDPYFYAGKTTRKKLENVKSSLKDGFEKLSDSVRDEGYRRESNQSMKDKFWDRTVHQHKGANKTLRDRSSGNKKGLFDGDWGADAVKNSMNKSKAGWVFENIQNVKKGVSENIKNAKKARDEDEERRRNETPKYAGDPGRFQRIRDDVDDDLRRKMGYHKEQRRMYNQGRREDKDKEMKEWMDKLEKWKKGKK